MRVPKEATVVSSGSSNARNVVVLDDSGKIDISLIPASVIVTSTVQEANAAENITVDTISGIVAAHVQAALEALADTKLSDINNLSELANPATARTNLGLGSIATQAADAVAITGGDITGITNLTASTIEVSTLSAELNITSNNLRRGTTDPEGAIPGRLGDLYQRTNGTQSHTLYIKESGTDNSTTGWKAVVTKDVQTISYAANVTPATTGNVTVNLGTLTGDVAIAAPTGTPSDAQVLTFRLEQDAAGGRIITWATDYAFGTDITTDLIPITPFSKWEMMFKYHALTSKWRCVAIIRGF